MRLLIQRVSSASVEVEGEIVGAIGPGALVFLGIHQSDTSSSIAYLSQKLINLRMFADGEGKMNLSLLDTKGSILLVSQFTLYADCSSGRRPSFIDAAAPPVAEPLYEEFIATLRKTPIPIETGRFGALMKVSIQNDGPLTFIIDSK